MSGVKGRSGRKPNYIEIDVNNLVKKSNYILNDFFDSNIVPIQKKAEVAIQLSKRLVTDKQDTTIKIDYTDAEKQEYNRLAKSIYSGSGN